MFGSKVTEVPFGSNSLCGSSSSWFLPMLSRDPGQVLCWIFPLPVIDHVLFCVCFIPLTVCSLSVVEAAASFILQFFR